MTPEEIISNLSYVDGITPMSKEDLLALILMEREACAQIASNEAKGEDMWAKIHLKSGEQDSYNLSIGGLGAATNIEIAIRARGKAKDGN